MKIYLIIFVAAFIAVYGVVKVNEYNNSSQFQTRMSDHDRLCKDLMEGRRGDSLSAQEHYDGCPHDPNALFVAR